VARNSILALDGVAAMKTNLKNNAFPFLRKR